MSRDPLSRPLRAAARLAGRGDAELRDVFLGTSVCLRLGPDLAGSSDARETVLYALNQIVRFCPGVIVELPEGDELAGQCRELAAAVHGPDHELQIVESGAARAKVELTVANAVYPRGMTINSDGWLARASGPDGVARLPEPGGPANVIGALGAACLGAARVFEELVGFGVGSEPIELSLFERRRAAPGDLTPGPALPSQPVGLNGWLVGCGAVANGWSYAVARLPIDGELQAVDRQALGAENGGSYVLATRERVGLPKAEIVATELAPRIAVVPRPEPFEYFGYRLRYGQLSMPSIVVNGLDNVATRHAVQRMWPELLIDMGAGALTSQVITKDRSDDGLCLLGALSIPPGAETQEEVWARENGLRLERLLEPESAITQADVAAAPAKHRPVLEAARQRGELVCGRVTAAGLSSVDEADDFAPAVPFVTAFSGLLAAAETLKALTVLSRRSVHVQFDFGSRRLQARPMRCLSSCECRRHRRVAPTIG